ncbi:Oxoglutarate/iron-dependent dioxygenase [Parasponia andersonii]|uniref:Oxoglutarate/iron-dependent dioxygenase n=1 Tax=Parasponia andersonii TaxID=3476 RepID=A0A2P5C0N2_PARAD|nr:Oxoglutarate/iron-dependent dioxygenase [Parasponia andersonii]
MVREPWWLDDAEFLDTVSGAWANHNFDRSANIFMGGLVRCASNLKLLCAVVGKSWSDPAVVEGVKREIQELFNLPKEEKNKFWQQPGDMEGFGQAFVASEEQNLTLGRRFLLDDSAKTCRDSIEACSAELEKNYKSLLDLMPKALRMEDSEMRMNYYPPCPQPDLVIGVNPHSDATGLTILLQNNETEGL